MLGPIRKEPGDPPTYILDVEGEEVRIKGGTSGPLLRNRKLRTVILDKTGKVFPMMSQAEHDAYIQERLHPSFAGCDLSVSDRAVLEVFLQCKVAADGRVTRLRHPQPAWEDIVDAAIVADLFATRVAGREGLPLAMKMIEKVAGSDACEGALAERVEVVGHWLSPRRERQILRIILDTDDLLDKIGARSDAD